jgi:hypothetical protein
MLFLSVSLQHRDLKVGQQNPGGELRACPAQQGHQHDAPGDDEVDANGALETIGAVVGQILDPAAGLEHPMPVFDASAQAIPVQTGMRVSAESQPASPPSQPCAEPIRWRNCGPTRGPAPEAGTTGSGDATANDRFWAALGHSRTTECGFGRDSYRKRRNLSLTQLTEPSFFDELDGIT